MPNGNPFYVDPLGGYGPSIGRGLQGLGAVIKERRDVQQQRQRAQAAQTAITQAVRSGDAAQVADVVVEYPEYQKQAETAFGFASDETRRVAEATYSRVLADPENAQQYLSEGITRVQQAGGTPVNMQRDLQAFAENPEAALKSVEFGVATASPELYKAYRAGLDQEGSELKVGAQEILEDGTIIQSTTRGPVVYNPLGERVRGQAAADAVKQAQAEKVRNARMAAGEKRRAALEAENELKAQVEAGVVGAKEAAKASVDAFNRLQSVRDGLKNIDEAIGLIDQGASTGAIQSRLPSVRAASVKLDNLQGRLGLDVIGNTTFGALSEAELKFALATALPQRLEGPELKNWLTEKKAAQEKLADYLESAAIFLGTPGNTHSDWLKKKRSEQREVGAELFSGVLNRAVTEQDIMDTLSANPGLTREQLLEQLQVR